MTDYKDLSPIDKEIYLDRALREQKERRSAPPQGTPGWKVSKNRSDILDTARGHITKDRAAAHGKAEDTFAQIAALWSADLGIPLSEADVARLMVLFKMARAKGNPGHLDNWIDAAGYAALAGELAQTRPEPIPWPPAARLAEVDLDDTH